MWFVDQFYQVNNRVHYVGILDAVYNSNFVSFLYDELVRVLVHPERQVYYLGISVDVVGLQHELSVAASLQLFVKYVSEQV